MSLTQAELIELNLQGLANQKANLDIQNKLNHDRIDKDIERLNEQKAKVAIA